MKDIFFDIADICMFHSFNRKLAICLHDQEIRQYLLEQLALLAVDNILKEKANFSVGCTAVIFGSHVHRSFVSRSEMFS